MELQGIQSSMIQNSAMRGQTRSLTDEQKTQLEEILSKYDPEKMTDENRQALMEELKTAGIPLTRDAAEILEKSGFERPEGPPPPPPGPPPQDSGTTTPLNATFVQLMEQYQAGEIAEEEFLDQLNMLKEQIVNGTGGLIDTTA
jgi:hypothetical protein